MKRLIVCLFCILVLQGCAALAGDKSVDPGPQPVITMTPGSWR
jgi:PBP1b-binding outer membrane lipoprotein LpoB